jgi:hypothetical protein
MLDCESWLTPWEPFRPGPSRTLRKPSDDGAWDTAPIGTLGTTLDPTMRSSAGGPIDGRRPPTAT